MLVSPDKHLGGLSSGGLGWTDTGNKSVIGGLTREFYHRVWQEYQAPETWRWQSQASYGNQGQGTPAIDGVQRTMWIFEPHVAETVFEKFVQEHGIPVHRDQWLDRESGVVLSNGRIKSIRTLDGSVYHGKVFIDATYEGDLLAAAGIQYAVGRESREQYSEDWNGIQTGVLHHRHHFGVLPPISPYRIPNDPQSGLLPLISADPPGTFGAADHRVQAYCFRMCLTSHPENRVSFPRPENYDPGTYELLLRVFSEGWRETFDKFDPIPNHKTDTNNHGPLSTDFIGMNYDYPEANYARRREIIASHREYQQGWLYFIANDPRVPEEVQQAMRKWGLPKDEFLDNDHWPHQIYVREARRMIGKYVMTENDLLEKIETPQSVGMGSYTIDSHNVQRYVTADGFVQNEGDIGVPTAGPYEIALGSLLPARSECQNLVVPVCISSSHIAFGSIRMEPVFMILGQSAATVAAMAIDQDSAVQDVSYDTLMEKLTKDGQILHAPQQVTSSTQTGTSISSLEGTVIDDERAMKTGDWNSSHATNPYVGIGYRHDAHQPSSITTATFATDLPHSGRYEVRISYSSNANRATNVPVQLFHANGVSNMTVNQQQAPEHNGLFHTLGQFDFSAEAEAKVIVSNQFTDGHVIIDAVQWIPL